MSLPRSIDRTDLSGGTVTLTTTAETVVLVGPNLQTPKDTSFILGLCSFTLTTGTGATGAQARVRQGATTAGAQIGATYTSGNLTAAQGVSSGIMVSAAVQSTDYVQWCLTLQQVGATGNGTVNGATLAMWSF
jgi:hypothetical protein